MLSAVTEVIPFKKIRALIQVHIVHITQSGPQKKNDRTKYGYKGENIF